ncbi:TetR/AcrR family transcriptional regulator [Candidatus Protochlamydia phocaeensis]|uniref:TetR/AcrR family transcriptional regulator n=1 Tax=Candidatus Protochlamydia phocaeensis TaxID=1414722 RepID=UPI0008386BE7|nr:TetR/AcrR family transcriptional regulator [Candidatus Protochlamydia phocaeensis]
MKEEKKRSYYSENRDAQAAQTRCHILKAAKRLFQTEGFDRVTINKLAQAAEVSMPTIYAIFKSKRGILQSLIDEAFPPEQFAALIDNSMQEESPKNCLSLTAKLSRQIYDAEKELMDILRGASVVAPEFKELEQEREQRRYNRQGEYINKMMKAKFLAKGLPLQKARDILWTLTGRDMYRMLVVERKWSSDEYEEWLAQLLIHSLLDIERK